VGNECDTEDWNCEDILAEKDDRNGKQNKLGEDE
jgi:hypothetical protein